MSVTVLVAIAAPLAGVLIGWSLHKRSVSSSPRPTASQQQLDHVCELDRRISSALASLHAYEKRLLVGTHLSENGSASTRPSTPGSGAAGDGKLGRGHSPLHEPLDGKTLLDIKREVDEHLWECTSALTRATAVLETDTVRRAQELVDALVSTREALEEQERNSGASAEAVRSCVSALHRSRTRFLNTARTRLGLDPLSEDTEGRIEALAEQAFSPSHLPRPYVATGVRLPDERR